MKTKYGILLAVVIIIAGVGIWITTSKATESKTTFTTTKVNKGDISNSVTATGTVEPVTQVEVGTQVSGIIRNLYADYNSQVTKGQIIAELDKANLLNELASKKSTLASAKSEYEYQLKNYTRAKILHEKTLISDTDYESALYNYEKASNTYDVSKNDLAKAQTNLSYATIYSPIDGVILSRVVEEGQTVNAGMNTPTLFTIANDLTDMQVVANVDEADIGGVANGQRVNFTVDAYPNDTFEGVVTQVRQEATVTSNVVTYEVVISAPNPDLKLKPGLTANTNIYTLEKRDILVIPNKALRFVPTLPFISESIRVVDSEGKYKVWTQEGETFTAHTVEVGISNGVLTEIISGIDEGTVIVTDATLGITTPQVAKGEQSPFMPSRPGKGDAK